MVWFATQLPTPITAARMESLNRRRSHPFSPPHSIPHLPFPPRNSIPGVSFCSTLTSSSSPSSMAAAEVAAEVAAESYEEALICLSSLITRRVRGDGANRGDNFELMPHYLRMLELDEPVARLKVIHVAGTKGKGSTCSFTESILRNIGFRTGMFTSPHLIDVRERFRLEGSEISKEKFLQYFWWCWNRLQAKTNDKLPMPAYFRFLALLAFKIFTEEQVDVAILEVGLGGKFDATNVVKEPIVCGITSLGYDHMEILGNTLAEIAGEKAGIFKRNVPAYTVPQPEEAMKVLEDKAIQLGIPLLVTQPLDAGLLNGQKLGLDGEHQYLNAGLAVSLCHFWLMKTGLLKCSYLHDDSILPESFIRGLSTTRFLGRAQILRDPYVNMENSSGGLVFYLDGAHSPESMETCAKWFCNVIKKDACTKNILIFNCMTVRDPKLLLPRLRSVIAEHGVNFHDAIFVPNQSVYNKVCSDVSVAKDSQVDVSWQKTLQRVWQNLVNDDKYSTMKNSHNEIKMDVNEGKFLSQEGGSVFYSLPSALKWIRESTQRNRTIHFQVLVTGSLHLVGDVLRLIKK